MPRSLKEKTITGVIWTTFQRGGALLIGFIGNIILARLLTPDDYGCIGLLLIFTSIADVLIDGGLGSALVEKKELNIIDCSTVFTANLVFSIILFGILFICSPWISRYFGIPILEDVLRIESISIVLRASYIIPASLLNRNLKFKDITIITIVSHVLSIVLAIISACYGMGVWSLVVKNISLQLFLCVLYHFSARWTFSIAFSWSIFKSLFSFGGKIALSNIVECIFSNIESFVIGRRFSAKILGYYSQAKSLGQLPIYSMSMVANQVLFPVLSKLQEEDRAFVNGTRKSMISITYIAFPLITILCILSKPAIILLYSEKWEAAIPFLQMVCIAGFVNSVIHTNFSILKAKGKSNLLLFYQVVINMLKLLLILIGMNFGIMGILAGNIIGNYLGCIVLAYLSGKVVGYGLKQQIEDLYPSFLLSVVLGCLVFFIFVPIISMNAVLTIFVVFFIYSVAYILLSWILNFEGFRVYKEIIKNELAKWYC